jgi:glycosyltransferase involved in cell wall biosynthesis
MPKPAISIIMPVYNGAKYIEASIESILRQTYADFELIVIDDASTDGSKAVALRQAEKDPRIIVIDNTYQKGIHGASNSGLDISRGDFIAKADADDLQRPYRLYTQIDFFTAHPDIDIVGGGYELFGKINNVRVFHPSGSLRLAWKFISDIYFCNPTVMFRRKVLDTIPHYPSVVCEDFAFLSAAIKKHKGENIKQILIDYRQHETNYSKVKAENIKQSAKEIFEENFLFYTGALKDADAFHKFHAHHFLAIGNTLKVLKKAIGIMQKIAHQYDSKNMACKYLLLGCILAHEMARALPRYYLHLYYKKYYGK